VARDGEKGKYIIHERREGRERRKTDLANLAKLGTVAPRVDGVHEFRLEARNILVCATQFNDQPLRFSEEG
jgi:hypothetical protein